MQYGLIGEKLIHSFSKEIHAKIGDYDYELVPLKREELRPFLTAANFKAVNVTIPYKEAVLPYLDYVSPDAQKIGAVNLIVNRFGKLYGYNTDYYGAKRLIERANVQVKGKKALIFGSGGTQKTLRAVLTDLGAKSIYTVSRKKSDSTVDYAEATTTHSDAEILINTTPVGTFPDLFATPVDPSLFFNLQGAIDVVYNPLRTSFIEQIKSRNIPCDNGLFMLAAQAVQASAIMRDIPLDETLCESVYQKVLRDKQNVVLIGMPSCGKSTIGRILSKKTHKKFVDTDELIKSRTGMEIPELFARYGEDRFREEETAAILSVAHESSLIVATGGGIVKHAENIRLLKKNGKIVFLDRPIEALTPTADRPLFNDLSKLAALQEERFPLYKAAADATVQNVTEAEETAEKILALL